jgi:hypothetical protein
MALTLTIFEPQPDFEAACFGWVGLLARPKLKGDSAKRQIYGSGSAHPPSKASPQARPPAFRSLGSQPQQNLKRALITTLLWVG